MTQADFLHVKKVSPVEAPQQWEAPFLAELLEASRLVRAAEARATYRVDGAGTTVAVLDTGLRTTHADFARRVAAQRNFTADNGGDPANASDGHGHGTHVAGIVCAGDIHTGMAPAARIVPLKVLSNGGGGSFESIAAALQWVIDNRARHEITAVCMSLGDSGNYQADSQFPSDAVGGRIAQLARLGVACCVAAGNDYFGHGSAQGMSYPAIFRDALSVGAVYDGDEGPFRYQSGAEAFSTGPDRITPFSQRLHQKVGRACATDIFAPGAPMTSSGILNDIGESVQHGTSQPTPVVTGIVLLLQSLCKRSRGTLPTLAELRRWLERGGVSIQDGDDENDNVLHTGLAFKRIDAVAALEACAKEIAKTAFEKGEGACVAAIGRAA